MIQIPSKSDEYPVDHIKLQIKDPHLDIARAKDLAKAKARQLNKDAMLLSWYCGKTGNFLLNLSAGTRISRRGLSLPRLEEEI